MGISGPEGDGDTFRFCVLNPKCLYVHLNDDKMVVM